MLLSATLFMAGLDPGTFSVAGKEDGRVEHGHDEMKQSHGNSASFCGHGKASNETPTLQCQNPLNIDDPVPAITVEIRSGGDAIGAQSAEFDEFVFTEIGKEIQPV